MFLNLKKIKYTYFVKLNKQMKNMKGKLTIQNLFYKNVWRNEIILNEI